MKSPATRLVSEADWRERAQAALVGGVSSPVRSFRAVDEPLMIATRASGAMLEDANGNQYVDYLGSFGALLAGHAHPEVVAAVQRAAEGGTSYGITCPGEVELAEAVLAAWPWAERVRFVNSGTEAVMTALRLARGITGRSKVLRFHGCYHGHSDAMLVRGGSGLHEHVDASSAGVPSGMIGETLLQELDDIESIETTLAQQGSQIAAVLLEPIPANSGLLLQRGDFLRRLQDATRRAGALLVLDEVISGFRVAPGGACEHYDLRPDLVTLGKVLGGGLPVGAVIGRAQHLEQLAPLGPVYQAGTLSGNPLAMAAGRESVRLACDPEQRARLESTCAELYTALRSECARAPFPLQLVDCASIFWLVAQDGSAPRRPDQLSAEAVERYAALHRSLRTNGVLLAPSAWEVGFVSLAHDAETTERTVVALRAALEELAR